MLRELADLLDIRGASGEARELRRSAAAATLPLPRSFSPFTAALLKEINSGGGGRALHRARRGLPAFVKNILDAGLLSTADAARLVQQAGVVTFADLGQALDDGRIARHAGETLAETLRAHAESADSSQIPLGRAVDVVTSILADIASAAPMLTALEAAGDVRRYDTVVSQIVAVARADDPAIALSAIARMPGTLDILHRSARRLLLAHGQFELDVRVAAPDEYGTVLFTATGSRAHHRAMLARRARPALVPREDQVYADAGLPWIAPELREGAGEIEAAASGRLPSLLERRDIRGDLHMHSTYSDGRDSVAAMAEAASGLGYEYIAMTDHSQTAGASRTLALADIPRQRDEIASLREIHPGMTILHGVEVDILSDGTLDFPDEILQHFDIVLASLHDHCGHDGSRLTRRCLAAIRHPLVNVITHPANRIVGRRHGYPLDYEAIYAAAAETGTALEIDGAPGHLDLDGEHARAAARAGALLTVDSDCHKAGALELQMQLGVGTARRGWIEPRHVLNTRPIGDVLAFIAAKRASGGTRKNAE